MLSYLTLTMHSKTISHIVHKEEEIAQVQRITWPMNYTLCLLYLIRQIAEREKTIICSFYIITSHDNTARS